MKSWIPVIQAVIVGSIALFGIFLTQSWTTRRDFSKRRAEFCEEVLAGFYDVREAIDTIRNPFGFDSEGQTREKGTSESTEQTEVLNRFYKYQDRYKNKEAEFNTLRAKKSKFLAMFRLEMGGLQGGEPNPFELIELALTRIFRSANIIAQLTLTPPQIEGMSAVQVGSYQKQRAEAESIIHKIGNEDIVTKQINLAIKVVEDINESIVSEYVRPFAIFRRWNESR